MTPMSARWAGATLTHDRSTTLVCGSCGTWHGSLWDSLGVSLVASLSQSYIVASRELLKPSVTTRRLKIFKIVDTTGTQ